MTTETSAELWWKYQIPTQTLGPGDQLHLQNQYNPLVIQLAPQSRKNLFDVEMYAPAIPGVVVALAGLVIAHWLSVARDRRKELRDLCNDLKLEADNAATAAMSAWTLRAGSERLAAIHETKRKLQTVGILATSLLARTKGRTQIDVVQQVAELRRASTADPLEEPRRRANEGQVGAILATLAQLLHEVEEGYGKRYR